MAISSETRRAGPFQGNGTQTTFEFEFKIFDPSEVRVMVSTDNGETESELDSDLYDTELNADQDGMPGGTVTLTEALAEGSILSILSDVPYLQPMVLTNRGGFYPDMLNDSSDRAVILAQQNREILERTLKVPSTSEKTPEQVTAEIMDIAAEANEYAAKAEETYQAVLETQREVLETQTQITEAQEEVEKDRQEVNATAETVADILDRAEEIDEGVSQLVPIVDDIDLVGDHMGSVITVADDLQGYPLSSMDFGLITEPPEPTTVVDGGNVKTVADSIDDVVAVSSNLEEVLQADDNAATATQKASEASASASAAADSANAAKESEDAALSSQNAAKASADSALASKTAAAESARIASEGASAVTQGKEAALQEIASAGQTQKTAVESAGSAQVDLVELEGQEWRDLAKAWAQKMDGKVEVDASDEGAGFSSRYYATQAKNSADAAAVDETALSQAVQTATAKAAEASTSAAQAAESATTATGAATTATTAATTATTKATEAAQSATDANSDQVAANTARAKAVEAQGAAEAAQEAAESSAAAAAGSASSAESAKTAAETAKTQAETAKSGAESAKTAALAAQAAAEAARDEAADISESIGSPLGKDEADATYAPISHTHTTEQVTGLDTALAGKAASGHTHTLTASGDATGTATLGNTDATLTLTLANSGVTEGSAGPTADATLAFAGTFVIPYITVDAKGRVTAVGNRTMTMPNKITWDSISEKPSTFAPSEHTHEIADVTELQTALDGKAAATHTHESSQIKGLGTLATKSTVGATELADQIDLGELA